LERQVDEHFFDLEIYSIYRAAFELFGVDNSWRLVWKSGEILFGELSKEIDLQAANPIELLRKLARYLERAGYVRRLEIRQVATDEIEYEMLQPAIGPGAVKLINEGGAPAHISTSLLFAGLKLRFGMKAEMIGDPTFLEDGRVIEKWKLSKPT